MRDIIASIEASKTDIIVDDSNVLEKFNKTHDKLFMTMDEAIALSREIAHRVLALPEQPEIVVGIGHGADVMSRVISTELHIPVETILIQRKGGILKEKLSRIPGLRALISQWYRIPGLNIPLKSILNFFSSLSRTSAQSIPIVHGKRILLVDDAIETGQALRMAKEILNSRGPHSINTAVLVWLDHSNVNKDESIRPDIFIGRKGQHFPWSKNSPYWHECESWLKQPQV